MQRGSEYEEEEWDYYLYAKGPSLIISLVLELNYVNMTLRHHERSKNHILTD